MLFLKLIFFGFFAAVTYWAFDPEQALGMIALVGLVLLQVWFLAGRIKRKSTIDTSAKRTASVIKGLAAQSQVQRRKIAAQPQPKATPSVEPAVPASAPKSIDPSVFSKFQHSLDQTQEAGSVLDDEPDEVVVNLSQKAPTRAVKKTVGPAGVQKTAKPAAPKPKPRNPYAGAALKPSATMDEPLIEQTRTKEQEDNSLLDQVPSAPLGDLFDSLDEGGSTKKPLNTVTPKPRRPQQETGGAVPPMATNETLEFHDLDQDEVGEEKIAGLQLKSAQKAFREKQFEKAAGIAQDWLKGEGKKTLDLKESLPFIELVSNSWWALHDYTAHLKFWETIFGSRVPKSSKEYLPLLEERIDEYVKAGLEAKAIPFLLTALSAYKAQADYIRMDSCYQSLEKAYRTLGEEKALAQCLDGHLGIKRQVKDFTGQLEILNELGKLMFDQGDQAGSKRCYEESLVIKQQMQGTKP